MVESDNFCIHHDMLHLYGVSSLTGGSGDIKKIINQNEFIEDEDYLLRIVSEQHESGTKYKNEYYFCPRAFKICLMRSLKTRKYAEYYLFLEEVIYWFNKFQIQKLETDLFIANNNKIMDLIDKDKLDQVCIVK